MPLVDYTFFMPLSFALLGDLPRPLKIRLLEQQISRRFYFYPIASLLTFICLPLPPVISVLFPPFLSAFFHLFAFGHLFGVVFFVACPILVVFFHLFLVGRLLGDCCAPRVRRRGISFSFL